jgi:hypothetical protein
MVAPGSGPHGAEHRVVAGVVNNVDHLGEPLADCDPHRSDRYQASVQFRQ